MTASHCICLTSEQRSTYRRKKVDLESFTSCNRPLPDDPLSSVPTRRLNQHSPFEDDDESPIKDDQMENLWDNKMKTKSSSFNHVAVKIGSRDFTTGVFQTVDSAFNMYVIIKKINVEKPDIALVIVKTPIKRLSMDYPERQVGPICLPSG